MNETALDLMAQVVTGYLSNNKVSSDQLPDLIRAVYRSLTTAGVPPEAIKPAVEVKKSVFADHIVCLACGGSYSMMKRHLKTVHQLVPEEYRARYELPQSYPMVAPNYAKVRSALAKKIGLGRKPGGEAPPMKRAGRKRTG